MPFEYMEQADLETIYGIELNEDQLADLQLSITYSCERINYITGGKIEAIGYDNLSDLQKDYVKRASCHLCKYYLEDGTDFIRTSSSVTGGSFTTSESPPANEPDYVPNEVYNLLELAGLYKRHKSIKSDVCISCNNSNCDNYCRVNLLEDNIATANILHCLTWDNAYKMFLRPTKVTSSGRSITITNTSTWFESSINIEGTNAINPVLELLDVNNGQVVYKEQPTFDDLNALASIAYVNSQSEGGHAFEVESNDGVITPVPIGKKITFVSNEGFDFVAQDTVDDFKINGNMRLDQESLTFSTTNNAQINIDPKGLIFENSKSLSGSYLDLHIGDNSLSQSTDESETHFLSAKTVITNSTFLLDATTQTPQQAINNHGSLITGLLTDIQGLRDNKENNLIVDNSLTYNRGPSTSALQVKISPDTGNILNLNTNGLFVASSTSILDIALSIDQSNPADIALIFNKDDNPNVKRFDMSQGVLYNLPTPQTGSEAANKAYVDSAISGDIGFDTITQKNNSIDIQNTIIKNGNFVSYIIGNPTISDENGLVHKLWVESYTGSFENNNNTFESKTDHNADISTINTKLSAKQNTLVSGTNIKSINTISLLGSGNINIPVAEGTWTPVGTKASATQWNNSMSGNSRYRVTYHWEAPGTTNGGGCRKEIDYWGVPLVIDQHVNNFSGVTVLGLTVLGSANIRQIRVTPDGITIDNFLGTGTNGEIEKLELLT